MITSSITSGSLAISRKIILVLARNPILIIQAPILGFKVCDGLGDDGSVIPRLLTSQLARGFCVPEDPFLTEGGINDTYRSVLRFRIYET